MMRSDWPEGAEVAVSLTFDVDAESGWLGSDPASFAAIYRMLVELDLGSELARISCPVLLIAGALDATRPPALVEAIAGSITNARYLLLPTGHYAAIQTPEILTAAVLEFMACSIA